MKETGKISYTLETIAIGMVGFVNKVLKKFEGKTAYQGYTFEVKQQKEAETPADEAQTAKIEVTIKSKDLSAIKETSSEEKYQEYLTQLGLFVCLSNSAGVAMVYGMDTKDCLQNESEGTFKKVISVGLKSKGDQIFKVHFCDNKGFHTTKELKVST